MKEANTEAGQFWRKGRVMGRGGGGRHLIRSWG